MFFYINDDLCYRDTPFFVREIRAAAASVRRSHVARLPRSPNPYAHLPTTDRSSSCSSPPPTLLQNCEIRAIVTEWGWRAGGRPAVLLIIIIIIVVILFCQRPMTRETESKTLYNIIYVAFTHAIIYLYYAHISICVRAQRTLDY